MGITTTKLRIAIFFFLLYIASVGVHAECQYKQIISGEELSVGIMLNWSTSMERENAMFIIERSDDGIQFSNVGAVKGAGHSKNQKEYSFLDKSTPTGQRYYRLRQIDFNGVFSTSPIFIFNNNDNQDAFAISNMSSSIISNRLEIQFDAYHSDFLEYELMDWQGKSLLVNSTNAKEGFNTLQIDLSDFEDIIYRLTLRSVAQEQTITFRKR